MHQVSDGRSKLDNAAGRDAAQPGRGLAHGAVEPVQPAPLLLLPLGLAVEALQLSPVAAQAPPPSALSESLADTIRHHHNPEETARNAELTNIVYLADLIMSRFQNGLELERLSTATLSSRLRTIGCSIEKFSEIVDLIPAGVFKSEPELALMQ